MARRHYAEHARVTAICVNLALDGVEDDIRAALTEIDGEASYALQRLLKRIQKRRVAADAIKPAGTC